MSGTVSELRASGRSSVIVAIASSTFDAEVGHQAGRRRARELDELAVDELEDPPVDRLVGAARLLDDEVGEERGELVVARPERAGDQEMPLRHPDEDPPDGAELAAQLLDHLGQQDPGRVPAVAGVRREEPPLAR